MYMCVCVCVCVYIYIYIYIILMRVTRPAYVIALHFITNNIR